MRTLRLSAKMDRMSSAVKWWSRLSAAVTGAVLALLSNWQVPLTVLLAVTGLVLLAVNVHELVGSTGRRKRTTPAGPDRS